MPKNRLLGRILSLAVPLVLGALVAGWLMAGRTPPALEALEEATTPVAAVAAPEVSWRPRATGYGTAGQPAHGAGWPKSPAASWIETRSWTPV